MAVEFIVRLFFPVLHVILVVLTFIVLAMCFYRVVLWFYIDRPAELAGVPSEIKVDPIVKTISRSR